MEKIYIVYYTHNHGADITAWKTLKSAQKCAETIRKEWHPKSKSFEDITEDSMGRENVEILESFLSD